MGLDMYLFSIPRIEGMELEQLLVVDYNLAKWKKEGNALYQKVKDYIKHYNEFDRSWDSIKTEIAYWRKANQIHHWFVENVQDGIDDCSTYEVKRYHAVILYNNCEMILANTAKAEGVLPTKAGFFWGSTCYDSYYYQEIKKTYALLENLLLKPSFFEENFLLYQSSW